MASLVQKSVPVMMLSFGVFVLGTSLLSANKISVGDRSRLLGQKMYLGRTILPDNVLYPVVMVGDRIKLESANPEDQILLRVEYAERRYSYAMELLGKNENELALTTLSKSQKYLFAASNEVLANAKNLDPQTVSTVQDSLVVSVVHLDEFTKKYPGENGSIVSDLKQQTIAFIQSIENLQE